MYFQNKRSSKNWFVRIYGGTRISSGGPLFFLLVGLVCSFVLLSFSILGGTFDTGIFWNPSEGSARPPINFPVFGIIYIILVAAAVVGLIMGITGIIWFLIIQRSLEES